MRLETRGVGGPRKSLIRICRSSSRSSQEGVGRRLADGESLSLDFWLQPWLTTGNVADLLLRLLRLDHSAQVGDKVRIAEYWTTQIPKQRSGREQRQDSAREGGCRLMTEDENRRKKGLRLRG
jgi:hypothetical protein